MRNVGLAVEVLETRVVPSGVYTAVDDFSRSSNTDTDRWSYRLKAGTVRDGNYALLRQFSPDKAISPFLTWAPGPSPGLWGVPGTFTPWVGVNGTGTDQGLGGYPGFSFPGGAMLVHPDTNGLVIVSWLSPANGVADIEFGFNDADPNGGNGIQWFVEINGAARTLASGAIPNGGGTGIRTLQAIDVHAGERVNFIVDPNGDYSYDSTRLTARIAMQDGVSSGSHVPHDAVAWWPGEGSAKDTAGTNDGTLQNGASFLPGEVGSAFHFDGVDDYVQAPTAGLPTGNNDRTLELWARVDAFDAPLAFLAGYGNFGALSQTYHLGTQGSTLFFSQWGAALFGPSLEAGQWYHIAVTNVGNLATLYLDGQAVASGTLPISTPAGSQFYMGRIPGSLGDSVRLKGSVDEVSVYDRALSPSEIQAIFTAGPAGKQTDQPPTISAIPNQTTNEDARTFPIPFSVGDAVTTAASLLVAGTSSNPVLVPEGGIVFGGSGGSRSLTVTPAANQSGTTTITVTLTDSSGGTATDTFLLTVNPVNDAPTFTEGANQTVNEDAGPQAVPGWATDISAGPPDEAEQTLNFVVMTNSDPGLFAVPPAIDATGTLTYVPAEHTAGSATVTVVLKDNGGTANGGVDTSSSQTFTITVKAAPLPTATDDIATTTQGTAVHIHVLGNDIDPAGQGLSITILQDALVGTATVNDNGTPTYLQDDFITYVPRASIVGPGTDSFSYRIADAHGHTAAATVTVSVALGPATIRAAYGLDKLSFDGKGQAIAIVDAYNDRTINKDLDEFDKRFGLTSSGSSLYQQYGCASAFLTVYDQNGNVIDPPTTMTPAEDPGEPSNPDRPPNQWEGEVALDVEWAHAIAPGARIVLIECSSSESSDLMKGVATANILPAVSVVSMSWGNKEGEAQGLWTPANEAKYDPYFTKSGVTYVVSTGDSGYPGQYPAYSPNVVAVGGTQLSVPADGSYLTEIGWTRDPADHASGGGFSKYEAEPSYQLGVQFTGKRTIPDVGFVAVGAVTANSYDQSGSTPWEHLGGTSWSAPCWAGLIALANQGRVADGIPTLDGRSQTLPALYSLPESDFHHNLGGDNGTTGNGIIDPSHYNEVTGLGSPRGDLLIPDLIKYGKTRVVIQSSRSSPVAGEVMTFTATVAPLAPVTATPTGLVDFFDNTTHTALGSALLLSAGIVTLSTPLLGVGTHEIVAVYRGQGGFLESSGYFTQSVSAVTPDNLGLAFLEVDSVIIQANTTTDADTVIRAVNGMSSPSPSHVTVTVNLGPGSYTDVKAGPPRGVTLVINGDGKSTTINGGSPALTVTAGEVIVTGLIFTTATDAPTILVTGGTVTLRNDTIEESTGYAEAAVSVTGGSVDLGTSSDPGGNILNINGAGELVHSTTPSAVAAFGDAFEVDGALLPAPYLSFTAVTSSTSPSVLGQPVSITAVVQADALPGSASPGGVVDFYDLTSNTDLGAIALSAGTASLSTADLSIGSHLIQVSYRGDTFFAPSLDSLDQVVNPDGTTTGVVSSAAHSPWGQSVRFTATVSPEAPGSGSPGGTVTFLDGSTVLGTGVLQITNGLDQANFTTSFLEVGGHTITAVYGGDVDFLASTSGSIADGVDKATPTIVWPHPADITYGAALDSGLLNATALVSGSFAYTPSVRLIPHAGTGQVLSTLFTPSDAAHYTAVTQTVELTVRPAPLRVIADGKSKIYGDANPGLTVSYSGFVNGDSPASLSTPPVLATQATTASHVGGYTIEVSGASDSDYAISFLGGTLSITPALVTVTADNQTRLYGDANPVLTGRVTGMRNNDILAASYSTPATPTSPVGSYPVTATLVGTRLDNYAVTYNTGTLTVAQATLMVRAVDALKVYGEALPTVTASITGFKNGETLATSGSSGSPVLATAAGAESSPGNYDLTAAAGTLAAGNYRFTFVNGTLTVVGSAVRFQPDPADPAHVALVVGGTPAADQIVIKPKESGAVTVIINGVTQGNLVASAGTTFSRVIVYGGGGDDDLQVDGAVRLTADLFGGTGNDRLKGGHGDNVLIGGDGDDVLIGGSGRDILVGGFGNDRLTAGAGDDILVGGSTAYDANEAALLELLREWARADLDYAGRVAHITGGGGLNGSAVLNAMTVFNDATGDRLAGDAGRDLFFVSAGDVLAGKQVGDDVATV